NELDAAAHYLTRCISLAERFGLPAYQIPAQLCEAKVLQARGDLGAALDLVEQALGAAQQQHVPPMIRTPLESYRVVLWLKHGNVAAAAAWAAAQPLAADANRPPLTAFDDDRFALAQTLLAQRHWDAAQNILSQLLPTAEATGHGRFAIWALI